MAKPPKPLILQLACYDRGGGWGHAERGRRGGGGVKLNYRQADYDKMELLPWIYSITMRGKKKLYLYRMHYHITRFHYF